MTPTLSARVPVSPRQDRMTAVGSRDRDLHRTDAAEERP
jgi:hypothetical protein